MPIRARHIAALVAVTLAGLGLSGCSSINANLAAGMSDAIPAWAGGLPADAPPPNAPRKLSRWQRKIVIVVFVCAVFGIIYLKNRFMGQG